MYLTSSGYVLCVRVFAAACRFPHYLHDYFLLFKKFQNAVKGESLLLLTIAIFIFIFFFVPSVGKPSMFNFGMIQSFSLL